MIREVRSPVAVSSSHRGAGRDDEDGRDPSPTVVEPMRALGIEMRRVAGFEIEGLGPDLHAHAAGVDEQPLLAGMPCGTARSRPAG